MVFDIRHFKSHALVWWSGNRDKIDMQPPYQRKGRLWSTADKGYLIDSIINGFDIPKLYIADFQLYNSRLNKKKLPYAIIDGKQRLEAVLDFFDGRITLNGDFIYREEPALKVAGLGLKDLQRSYPVVADAFKNASLDVMSVVTDQEKDINELFVRLNRSKPLTGAEIRNAMVGPVSDMARNIAKHEFFSEYIRFKTTRGEDLNTVAKLLLFEYMGEPIGTKKIDLDDFAQSSKKEKKEVALAAHQCVEVLDKMVEVFLPRDALLGSSGTIPVYYWFVRSVDPRRLHKAREFLSAFETARQENRAKQRDNPAARVNATMSRYDTLNRSTNDIGSHTGRFEILMSSFKLWLKTARVV